MTTQREGESIDSMQIRGITLKGIITIILCTASIVFSVLFTFFEQKSDIRSVREKMTQDEKYYDLRMKSIELNIEILERRMSRTFGEEIKQAVREAFNENKK